MKSHKNFLDYIKFHHNIDEEKNKEEVLLQHNLLMTTILEKSPIGFAVNTINDGKAIFISDKFEEIYGVPKDSIHDVDSFFEKVYIDPVYREEMRKKTLDAINSGDASSMKWNNVHITTISGENKVVSAMNIPVPEQNLMVSVVQDVTENSKLEGELKKSSDILKSKLIEMETINSAMMDRELKMIDMKKQIEDLEKKLAEK